MKRIGLIAVILLLAGGERAQAAEFKTEQVSTRVEHTEVIDSENRLWGFGKNSSGQVGNGKKSDVYDAVQIAPSTRFKKVAAGDEHTAAITTEGRLLTWGNNNFGQLGDPFCAERSYPGLVYINVLEIGYEPYFVDVYAGHNFTIAVDSRDAVWAFGQNNRGQLGVGSFRNKGVLTKVGLPGVPKKIACNRDHCVCVTTRGSVYVWGANESGQLGLGTTATHSSPTLLPLLENARDVAAGLEFSIIVLGSGSVVTAGNGKYGAIGRNPGEAVNPVMEPIGSYAGIIFVSAVAGKDFSILVDNCGITYVAGNNLSGQLGTGTINSELSFKKLNSEVRFSKGDAGDTHSMLSDSEKNLWSWGTGKSGQLGNSCVKSYSPIQSVVVSKRTPAIAPTKTTQKGLEKFKVGGIDYSVTKKGVTLTKVGNTKSSVVLKKTVAAGGKKYKLLQIGQDAFSGCSKVKKITIEANSSLKIAKGAFRGLSKKCIVRVKTNRIKRAVLSSGINNKNRVMKVK